MKKQIENLRAVLAHIERHNVAEHVSTLGLTHEVDVLLYAPTGALAAIAAWVETLHGAVTVVAHVGDGGNHLVASGQLDNGDAAVVAVIARGRDDDAVAAEMGGELRVTWPACTLLRLAAEVDAEAVGA
ncbi:hypothetical protein AB0K15_46680 [Amycolatopsis sp. NPDC049253]|uniref:hypothetical protein n=1 Tax=Amycolatopsis sp. NPDC049253 TaxID=3155274 RepID=UPI0034415073